MKWSDYYRFDDSSRSLIIRRRDLPGPWINYLSNGRLHAFISQAGGGLCWWKSPTVFRITRYRHYNVPLDSPGFYFYIRERGGEIWSPSLRPCGGAVDEATATHQPGKTTFAARKGAVSAELSFFVTPDYDVLVWDLKLKNHSQRDVSLDLFPYVELSQLNWKAELFWGYYIKFKLKTWFDRAAGAVMYMDHGGGPRVPDVPLVFLASTLPVKSFCGNRDLFLGNYGSENLPQAVANGTCGNHELASGEPCAALQNPLVLEPGAQQHAAYFLGAVPGALTRHQEATAKMNAILAELRAAGGLERQRAKLEAWWAEHLGVFDCQIPDRDSARMINTWGPVNSVHAGRYSRSINATAPGIRGVGFRDTCQDMLAIAYRKPGWAADTLKLLLSQQYADGHVVHAVFPEEREPPWTSIHSDDHLWVPLLAYAILAETADFSLLQQNVPWLAPDHVSPEGQATVWEHLLACVRFTESRLGCHRIPLILHSDWNDIIGRFAQKGKGESVFAGQQYVVALRRLIEIAGAIGDHAQGEWLKDCWARQVAALLDCSWDGKWWRRGFDDDGVAFGSAHSPFGKLYLNPQTWAVLAEIGTLQQRRQALDEANRQLDTGIGLKKMNPGFKTWPEDPNPFSGYGPGTGENGAIFCHANTWAVMAEALLGNAERAWKYYAQILPHNVIRKIGVERYRAEPHAWLSIITGPENATFGWGSISHITGTAAWMDVAATQYLLGVRPELDGLRVEPCIPNHWKRFDVRRKYRGCAVNLEFRNRSGQAGAVKSIVADGAPVLIADVPQIPAGLIAGRTSLNVQVER